MNRDIFKHDYFYHCIVIKDQKNQSRDFLNAEDQSFFIRVFSNVISETKLLYNIPKSSIFAHEFEI